MILIKYLIICSVFQCIYFVRFMCHIADKEKISLFDVMVNLFTKDVTRKYQIIKFFNTPQYLYNVTRMNYFGCCVIFLIHILLSLVPLCLVCIMLLIYWIFHVGRKNEAKSMNNVTVGVYSNGEYIINIVPDKDLKSHIEYNKTFRFGRALFVNGKCENKGYLSDENIEKWENRISKMKIDNSVPSKIYH